MDRPIAKGDLVMVVRPQLCCGAATSIGQIFVVAEVWTHMSRCRACGARNHRLTLANNLPRSQEDAGWDVRRLIRIDPPALPESVETTEQVPA